MTSLLLGLAPVILGIPSALLAYTDYRHRQHELALVRGGATTVPMPAPARSVPTQPRPLVQPDATVHFRTTVDLGAPLSFPRRLLAGLIDTYGGALVAAFLTALAVDPTTATEEDFNATFAGLWLIWFIAVAAMNAYRRSPGKFLTGGKLVRYTNRSEPVSFWRSLGRLALGLCVPFSFWFIVGKGRRTAHDRLTDTVVVRVR